MSQQQLAVTTEHVSFSVPNAGESLYGICLVNKVATEQYSESVLVCTLYVHS